MDPNIPGRHTLSVSGCPGCTERRGQDGVWHPLGAHRAGCSSLRADITDRRQVLDEIEREADTHRSALTNGCGGACDHPLDAGALPAWRQYHEVSLKDAERLAQQTRAELWTLVADGAGGLEAPMMEAENILRLPVEDEEEDYWRARHEAAHAIVGLVLGRTLRYVTIEPEVEHHPDNRGATHWLDDGPPPRNVDAVTSWAGIIAGPEQPVAEGDLEYLQEIDGLYDNYRWGARRVYRAYERMILEFADELLRRRAMTGAEAAEWLRQRTRAEETPGAAV